jgi:YidC/Oxa1 family membrane protein insertase
MSPYELLDPAVHVAYLAVTGLASLLPHQITPGDRIALALVLVTWAVRAALLPLVISAARARKAVAAVAGEVSRLQRCHTDDPARLGRELRKAYRDAGVSPFAGFLPTLAQLPVVSTMYRLVVVPVVAGRPNAVLDAVSLSVPLGGHWPGLLAAAGASSPTALTLAGLLLTLTALAWVSSRQIARAATASSMTGTPNQDRSAATAARLIRLLPFATVGFAVITPPAVGLYLLASTAWTVAERAFIPA